MASENTIDSAVIKKTQDTLGKLISKPVLTDKLLRKPPFRFLHDIVKAIIKDTGYFNGLYTKAELDIANIKDRDAKIAFLQKLIDVLKLSTNESISARPSKIVAGHEADKSNQLLQLIASVIINKVDCQKAIKDVVSSKPANKSNTSSNKTDDKKSITEKSTKRRDSDVGEKTKIKVKDNKAEKVKTKTNKLSKEPLRENQKKEKLPMKSKKIVSTESVEQPESLLSQPSLTDGNGSEGIAVIASPGEEKGKDKTKDVPSPSHNEKKRESLVSTENSENLKMQDSVESEKVTATRRKSFPNVASQIVGVSQVLIKEESTPKKNLSPASSGSVKSGRSKAKNFSEESTTVGLDSESTDVKRQSTFVRENSNEASNRPRTSLRPPSVRPASARPGAPRRRDKNVEIILQPNEPVKMAGINVKVENFNPDLEDDGENLVIIENTIDKEFDAPDKVNNEMEEQQGHLVQQILETQKELVQTEETNTDLELSTSILQKRQSSASQMDSLRDVIQNLTRSINPLGKLMDFIPEDFDSMQLELSMWRDSYFQSSSELKKERSHTESAIEPMKAQLAQVNASIAEHIDLIANSRAKILQNYDKIFKLLTE